MNRLETIRETLPSLSDIRSQIIKSAIAAIVLAPIGFFLRRMLESWGILDPYARATGEFLRTNVSPDQLGWTMAGILSLCAYVVILWRIWRPRHIHHLPILAETKPAAALDVQFIPAVPEAAKAPPLVSPMLFGGLIEAKGVPSQGYTALRIIVRNQSAENLTGLVARLTRAEPAIDGLDGPIHLPLSLATKTRLDKLRNPKLHENLPPLPFNLQAGTEKQIEVVWLHSDGCLEAIITHEAGEAKYLVLGTHTLFVEVSGAGVPIVAGVKIEVADDDKQSWTPALIVEAAGKA